MSPYTVYISWACFSSLMALHNLQNYVNIWTNTCLFFPGLTVSFYFWGIFILAHAIVLINNNINKQLFDSFVIIKFEF